MNKINLGNFEVLNSDDIDGYYQYSKYEEDKPKKKSNETKYQKSVGSSKSSVSKQIIPTINCNKETIVLIDWDDTLFPTTWVTRNEISIHQISNMKPKHRIFFMKLDVIIYTFITQLMHYGKIFIITNAMGEWINLTKKLLPNTTSILKWVKIISARDMYSDRYDMPTWKRLCFRKLARKYMSKQKINNIISIGDAEYEYEALVNLYRLGNQKKYLKSIKLLGGTDYNEIVDQIIVLSTNVCEIINHDDHLDLVFTTKSSSEKTNINKMHSDSLNLPTTTHTTN